ncbi:MAG: IS110 family transposase, partial [Actinobacteria bacterium]|nr:IS110 family transposase [Actinomycetota bacterium]
MSSVAHRGYVHVGMDVSKDAIAVAVLPPDRDVAEVDKIFNDEESVRRLFRRLRRPSGLWACYEAGPTGYGLQRQLSSMRVRCDVVAPSLVPKGSGDRVKTDRRDARRLAGLHRAGELTAIAVPTPVQEAVRDLCRTRGDMVGDLTRARNRLSGFLLRHSVVWRGGSTWTQRHERWLAGLCFEDRALASTYGHYLAAVRLRDTALEAVEADLAPWCDREPFGIQVSRLAAYRGVTRMGALCLAAEVFDWRRFPRARPFMSFTGLVPSEHSTGKSQHRGHITRSGNAHIRGQLCEAAPSSHLPPLRPGPGRAHHDGRGGEVARRPSRPHLSPNTVAKAYRVLQGVRSAAVDAGLIARSPCTIKGAGTEQEEEMQIASPEEVAALAAAGPGGRR